MKSKFPAVLLLGNGMFEVNSINGVFHDQNTTTCFQMGNNNKLRSVFQKSIDYEIRLKKPVIIGQISIEVSGKLAKFEDLYKIK